MPIGVPKARRNLYLKAAVVNLRLRVRRQFWRQPCSPVSRPFPLASVFHRVLSNVIRWACDKGPYIRGWEELWIVLVLQGHHNYQRVCTRLRTHYFHNIHRVERLTAHLSSHILFVQLMWYFPSSFSMHLQFSWVKTLKLMDCWALPSRCLINPLKGSWGNWMYSLNRRLHFSFCWNRAAQRFWIMIFRSDH